MPAKKPESLQSVAKEDRPYFCHACLARFVVPSLARACEHEHGTLGS